MTDEELAVGMREPAVWMIKSATWVRKLII